MSVQWELDGAAARQAAEDSVTRQQKTRLMSIKTKQPSGRGEVGPAAAVRSNAKRAAQSVCAYMSHFQLAHSAAARSA